MIVTHGTISPHGEGCALAIGNFDGAHRGHQAIFARLVERARELGVLSSVLTFEPHPREYFFPHDAPARIASLRDKLEHMAEAGIEQAHVARFDAKLAGLPAERFIADWLVRGLNVRWVLVGKDFRFGARRGGDVAMLERAARDHGFRVETLPEVRIGGARVSSSAVRAALKAADFARAEELLGRPYMMSGRVSHGTKLGRALGFPTANIVLRHEPAVAGIFAVEVHDEENGWSAPGVASVGRRPTVNEVRIPLLEAHLFDSRGDLYGQHLRVRFHRKLREERKFDRLEMLRSAIAADVQQAKEYFSAHG